MDTFRLLLLVFSLLLRVHAVRSSADVYYTLFAGAEGQCAETRGCDSHKLLFSAKTAPEAGHPQIGSCAEQVRLRRNDA